MGVEGGAAGGVPQAWGGRPVGSASAIAGAGPRRAGARGRQNDNGQASRHPHQRQGDRPRGLHGAPPEDEGGGRANQRPGAGPGGAGRRWAEVGRKQGSALSFSRSSRFS